MVSASTVIILDTTFNFPRPNEYAEIGQTMPSIGGEAANTAIMLSKLGIKTKLDGNWLNTLNANKILGLLKQFEIDTSRLTVRENYGTEEIVIVDKTTRTVFGNYAHFHNGEKQWNAPSEEDVKGCIMAALDPYFRQDAELLARLCVKYNKPYVTLDCPYDNFITHNADAVVISHELRDQAYKDSDMNKVFENYLKYCKGMTIFTFGSDELWYARQGQKMHVFKPFKIEPVDTTGAGDSFRSGIIFGLLQKWDDGKTVEFASAVAANVCLTRPHTLNAPGLDAIQSFITKHK
jgi:sugar/nucleoside kinase (ribokinase family)